MREEEKRINRKQWQKHVEAQEQSGLSQKAYCREQGILPWRLSYYKNQFRKRLKENSDTPCFVAVEVKEKEIPAGIEVRVVLPNGMTCFIPAPDMTAVLKGIMRVLG